MRLVLLGPPGAGKGSLAALLKESFNLLHISTGDMLREELKNKTDIGEEAKKYIEKGELVPDEIVIKIIEKKLISEKDSNEGFMLDGFPRTKKQAESLDEILNNIQMPLDYVLYLEAELPLIIKRLTGRRICKSCDAVYHMINKPPKKEGVCDICGGELYQRLDDNEETIKNRMQVYLENTKPMVAYYEEKNKLKTIDGNKSSEDLRAIVTEELNNEL